MPTVTESSNCQDTFATIKTKRGKKVLIYEVKELKAIMQNRRNAQDSEVYVFTVLSKIHSKQLSRDSFRSKCLQFRNS